MKATPTIHVTMATLDSIPVIDLEGVLSATDIASCPQVQQIHQAFNRVGFVFLKNHGIGKQQVEDGFREAKDFFSLPLDDKKKYSYNLKRTGNCGYVSMETEGINPTKPGDLKECFQLTSITEEGVFPDEVLPTFRPVIINLYEAGLKITHLMLEIMGHALKLDDPKFFVNNHHGIGQPGNYTTLRFLHYPPLPPTVDIKPGQLRCGEHVDYGSITLLFPDPTGGLQVKCKDGDYFDVPFVPDTVLVNLGILMDMWTDSHYLATPHRVLIPKDEEVRLRSRQSIALFVHPDGDTVIESLSGSGKHPKITAYEDTYRRLHQTHIQ